MNIAPFATTAMAIMPHTDAGAALRLAFSLDVPFWPQLPHLGFSEDMYVQSLAGFPGVVIEKAKQRLGFDKNAFLRDLDAYLADSANDACFDITPAASATYQTFLERDLAAYPAVRGQVMGPISCGFRLIDENKKPVIYDDEVRPVLLSHVARAASAQAGMLARHNPNVFVFMDEPGLGMIFSGLSGYSESRADEDLHAMLAATDAEVAIHLCGRPDWAFLLRLPIAMLSFNAFAGGQTFVAQPEQVGAFLDRDGILCWGIVPTAEPLLKKMSADRIASRLGELFQTLVDAGIDRTKLVNQSMLAPATCNLAGTPSSVEEAFEVLVKLGEIMRAE